MRRKFIQFQVTDELHKEIRRLCAEWDINISEFMREAVRVYFESNFPINVVVSDSEKPKE